MKNKLIIKYRESIKAASTKKKFLQFTMPSKLQVKCLITEAVERKNKRIEYWSHANSTVRMREFISGKGAKYLPHTEYIDPKIPVQVIRHDFDHYKLVDSFRCTSLSRAEKVLAKRNKEAIISAEYYANDGLKTQII